MRKLKSWIKLFIRKIFGHKCDCCSHITRRCNNCPLYCSNDDVKEILRALERRDSYVKKS